MSDLRKSWVLGFFTGFFVGAAVVLAFVPDRAGAAPHERSCDGKPATFHVHRAKALIGDAYRDERWADPTPAKDSEKRSWQDHKKCVRDSTLRKRIEEYRERKVEAFELYRRYRVVAPYPGPNGTYWAIPWYVIFCETRANPGSWSIEGHGLGPYQFRGWPVPWPVDSFEDQLEHHEMASYLWTTVGSSQWACA